MEEGELCFGSIATRFGLKSEIGNIGERVQNLLQTNDLLTFYDSLKKAITLLQRISEFLKTRNNNRFQHALPYALFCEILSFLPSVQSLAQVCQSWCETMKTATLKKFM